MAVTVSRKAHFNAAHRLHNANWSDEKNKTVFGLCNNPNYHGHNYELIVSLTGDVDADTGFVYDMKLLKDIIYEKVEKHLDHKNLNLDIAYFNTVNPTAENIVMYIWNILRQEFPEYLKLEVTLYESPRNFVTYSK
ncbi:MAG: 6-pyruvoyl trahydropterin synthase family protein [Flavobacteriaceae bacterium]